MRRHIKDFLRSIFDKSKNAFKSVNMQTASSITISVTNEGKVEINFSYDEDILDTDFYFEEYEMNTFNDFIK